jgi:sugar phosphate isomerase/epimerase
MKTSLNGARLGAEKLSLLEFVDLAARHDFDGIDFSISAAMKAAQELGGPREFTLFLTDKGIAPAAFGLEVEWRHDEPTFQAGMGHLEDQARFAREIGASRCVTWMPPSLSDVANMDRAIVRRFGAMAVILEEYGVRLGLEWVGPHHLRASGANPMGPEDWIYTLPGTLELIERIGVPTVGLLVDSYHCYTTGVTPAEIAALGDDRIVHVHVNDAPVGVGPAGALDGGRVLPGAGEIDLVGFLSGLEAAGYEGFVAAEILAPQNLAADCESAAELVRSSLRGIGI